MLLGLIVFFLFIPTILLPIVGIAVWLILGPYFGARMAMWEHRDRAVPFAVMLGLVEASIVVSTVVMLLRVMRGFILLEFLEWTAIIAIYAVCMIFSAFGAWTLPERSYSF